MISAGNDIVSLTAINVTRTKGPEFYSKIISPREKALYDGLDKTVLLFEHFVWLLWSVKEAAFKYLHRLDTRLLFTPVKFVVTQLEIPPGFKIAPFGHDEFVSKGFDGFTIFNSIVSHKAHTLYAKTIICNEFISSVVNHTENFENVHWGIKRIQDTAYKHQSSAVREFAVGSGQWAAGLDKPVIDKNAAGVPVVLNDGKVLDVAISLSHHEGWVGYSLKILLNI